MKIMKSDFINASEEIKKLPYINLYDGAYVKYIWYDEFMSLNVKKSAFSANHLEDFLKYLNVEYNNFLYARSNMLYLSGFILLKDCNSWYERKINSQKEEWSLISRPTLAPYVMDF